MCDFIYISRLWKPLFTDTRKHMYDEVRLHNMSWQATVSTQSVRDSQGISTDETLSTAKWALIHLSAHTGPFPHCRLPAEWAGWLCCSEHAPPRVGQLPDSVSRHRRCLSRFCITWCLFQWHKTELALNTLCCLIPWRFSLVNMSRHRVVCECMCCSCEPYVHGGVDLCHGLIISGELVDLHPVADQLTGDFDFELGQLALGDGIRLGNDWDYIDLRVEKWWELMWADTTTRCGEPF